MADERDLELLDDYLTNRMREQDRSAFEQKLKADPNLQHEFALQKRLIQGIKEARVAELKSMLGNVAIPAGGSNTTLASKIILGTVVGLVIAAASLWYFSQDEQHTTDRVPETVNEVPAEKPAEPEIKEEPQPEVQQPVTRERSPVETDRNQTSAGTEHSKPSLAKRPEPLAAPGEKDPASGEDSPESDVSAAATKETSESKLKTATSLAVETETNNGRYQFHYQYRDGKLLLFGPFRDDAYDVHEFLADEKRTVFLFYKDQYYLLPDAGSEIKPLTAVTDPVLLKKLKGYRNSK